jgi:hypothetical protein
MTRPTFVVAVSLSLAAAATRLEAQSSSAAAAARIIGLYDFDSGQPIVGAEVRVIGTSFSTTTSTSGAVLLQGFPEGTYFVHARRLGYEAKLLPVTMSASDSTPFTWMMRPLPQELNRVVVEGQRTRYVGKLEGFGRRMREGHASSAAFITREEFERRRPARTIDMLYRVPGVVVETGPPPASGSMKVYVARGPIGVERSRARCQMKLYLDGIHIGESEHLFFIPPDDVEAMEVYKPAEVPIEYTATGSACGVILVWTR